MSEYINLGVNCDHCGFPIESKPSFQSGSSSIKGFEPMTHRHIHNKQFECKVTTISKAKPYSNLNLRDKYYKLKNR